MNTEQSSPAALLDSGQAAQRLGKSKSWLDTQRSKGRGPRFVRIGCTIRYRTADIDAYLTSSLVETDDTRQRPQIGGKAA